MLAIRPFNVAEVHYTIRSDRVAKLQRCGREFDNSCNELQRRMQLDLEVGSGIGKVNQVGVQATR